MYFNRILIVLILFFNSTLLFAQEAELSGIIKDENGMAVAGANVFLLPDRQQTTSDVSGSFSFKNLNYGKYTLQITAQGKAMLNQDITLTQQLTELKKSYYGLNYMMRQKKSQPLHFQKMSWKLILQAVIQLS